MLSGSSFVLLFLVPDEDLQMLVLLGLFELPCGGGDVSGGKTQRGQRNISLKNVTDVFLIKYIKYYHLKFA